MLHFSLCIWLQIFCIGLGGKEVFPGPSEFQTILLGFWNIDYAVYIYIYSLEVFPRI